MRACNLTALSMVVPFFLQAALGVVGRMLHLHSHAFGFAGTKDRRGITTQYITLFKVEPQRLAALNPR